MPYEVPVYVGHEYEHAEYDGQDYEGHGFEYPDEYKLEESYDPYGAYGHQAMTGLAHATPSHAAYGPAAYPPYAEYGFAHAVRDTFARFDRNRSGRLDYRLGLNPKPESKPKPKPIRDRYPNHVSFLALSLTRALSLSRELRLALRALGIDLTTGGRYTGDIARCTGDITVGPRASA